MFDYSYIPKLSLSQTGKPALNQHDDATAAAGSVTIYVKMQQFLVNTVAFTERDWSSTPLLLVNTAKTQQHG